MKFCTAINCMDGRVQLPVINFLTKRFEVDCVDSVTEPGPNGILNSQSDPALVESIFRRVDISVNHHGSCAIAIVGHYDCAGNPKDKPGQLVDTRGAMACIRERYPDVPVIGLWVGADWKASEMSSDS